MRKVILYCCIFFIAINANASDMLAMDSAVRSGDAEAVALLLKKGISPSVIINEGINATWAHSPLILAVKSKNVGLVKMLIQAGADVDYANVGSTTALKEAAKNDDDTIVTLLIDAQADVNFVDENEVPILFWAVSHKSKKTIPLLIKAGANPDARFNSMFYGNHSVREYFSQEGKAEPSVLKLL